MKIFIICSKYFYSKIPPIQKKLEKLGHSIELPNEFDSPGSEDIARSLGKDEHIKFKKMMYKRSSRITKGIDAVLVLNFEKHGIKNYIGGATFLEMYDAYNLNKKIYLYNEIPTGILFDEIFGFNPIIIKSNLKLIK